MVSFYTCIFNFVLMLLIFKIKMDIYSLCALVAYIKERKWATLEWCLFIHVYLILC